MRDLSVSTAIRAARPPEPRARLFSPADSVALAYRDEGALGRPLGEGSG